MSVNSSSFPRTAKLEKRRMKESNLQVVSDPIPLWEYGLFSGLPNRHKYKIKKEVTAYNCQYLRKDTGLISTKPTRPCDGLLFSFPLVGNERIVRSRQRTHEKSIEILTNRHNVNCRLRRIRFVDFIKYSTCSIFCVVLSKHHL